MHLNTLIQRTFNDEEQGSRRWSSYLYLFRRAFQIKCRFALSTALGLAFALSAWQTVAAQSNSLHAHVHGQAQIQIAVEKTQLLMNFSSPLYNFLGFERRAHNDKEKQMIEQLRQQAQNPLYWFSLPASAQCRLVTMHLDAPLLDSNTAPSTSQEKPHGNLRFEADFECKKPEEFKQLQIRLFESFNEIKRLKLTVIQDQKQISRTLSNGDTLVTW